MDTHTPTDQADQATAAAGAVVRQNRERFEATLRERGLPEATIATQVDRYYPRTKTK